ncbi:hypothetical protein M427DRAFT_133903 [Gonapodya prolifera JEL478]|uniref:Uncharacterized protein n=1 Tax=Gonapodya prolifera (strain JEL478) TaxID=1344416 RepID=A0A139AJ63_GONPJ|nr:hypothetical protein M427DRAFT_133903 [Gonapodya prolifera JEL478]|eukprot:KXS16830.1 hypothetical protein M427DRAFT_133903 [Gonapodya prolifera JEL478]
MPIKLLNITSCAAHKSDKPLTTSLRFFTPDLTFASLTPSLSERTSAVPGAGAANSELFPCPRPPPTSLTTSTATTLLSVVTFIFALLFAFPSTSATPTPTSPVAAAPPDSFQPGGTMSINALGRRSTSSSPSRSSISISAFSSSFHLGNASAASRYRRTP